MAAALTCAVVVAFAAMASIPVASSAALPKLNLADNATVSGLSAGAFMAVQYHVAFSSEVSGAGIVAGGPYYCSKGELPEALTICMNTPEAINLDGLYLATSGFASSGKIDDPKNLAKSRVFLYSGTHDKVVNPGSMHKLESYYGHYMPTSQISTEYTIDSAHGMPTLDYGRDCPSQGEPFIQKCNYDGAGKILQWVYGNNLGPAVTPVSSSVVQFDQDAYGAAGAKLNSIGYVYIPAASQQGAQCRLHIVFHGCEQQLSRIQTQYVLHTGYNGYAEANNLVILYPQCKASELSENPNACFDWWGYTNRDFATKDGPQMKVVKAMADALRGGNNATDALSTSE